MDDSRKKWLAAILAVAIVLGVAVLSIGRVEHMIATRPLPGMPGTSGTQTTGSAVKNPSSNPGTANSGISRSAATTAELRNESPNGNGTVTPARDVQRNGRGATSQPTGTTNGVNGNGRRARSSRYSPQIGGEGTANGTGSATSGGAPGNTAAGPSFGAGQPGVTAGAGSRYGIPRSGSSEQAAQTGSVGPSSQATQTTETSQLQHSPVLNPGTTGANSQQAQVPGSGTNGIGTGAAQPVPNLPQGQQNVTGGTAGGAQTASTIATAERPEPSVRTPQGWLKTTGRVTVNGVFTPVTVLVDMNDSIFTPVDNGALVTGRGNALTLSRNAKFTVKPNAFLLDGGGANVNTRTRLSAEVGAYTVEPVDPELETHYDLTWDGSSVWVYARQRDVEVKSKCGNQRVREGKGIKIRDARRCAGYVWFDDASNWPKYAMGFAGATGGGVVIWLGMHQNMSPQ
jgi:hypothetical protein